VLRCVRKSCVFVLASMLKLSLNVFSQRVRVSVIAAAALLLQTQLNGGCFVKLGVYWVHFYCDAQHLICQRL